MNLPNINSKISLDVIPLIGQSIWKNKSRWFEALMWLMVMIKWLRAYVRSFFILARGYGKTISWPNPNVTPRNSNAGNPSLGFEWQQGTLIYKSYKS